MRHANTASQPEQAAGAELNKFASMFEDVLRAAEDADLPGPLPTYKANLVKTQRTGVGHNPYLETKQESQSCVKAGL